MTFSYDLSSPVGLVRNLISDTVATSPIMYDEEIQAFLNMKLGDLFSTAALCLRRIASNKALTAKLVMAGNFKEDNRQIANDLRMLADSYDVMSTSIPADAQADIIATDFNYNQLIVDKVLRREPLDNS